MLASVHRCGAIWLWEVATGQVRCRFAGNWENAHRLPALAFSPDGQTLATGNDWTTILLWDVTGRSRSGQPATGKQPARDLTATWEDLASPDASSAYEAIGRLVRAPNQTIPFLRGRFRPIPRPDLKRQAQLVRDLDDDSFEVREKASQELATLGETAASTLQKALRSLPSPEVQWRVEELLKGLKSSSFPERLRVSRALEALQFIGGFRSPPPACGVGRRSTRGEPDARSEGFTATPFAATNDGSLTELPIQWFGDVRRTRNWPLLTLTIGSFKDSSQTTDESIFRAWPWVQDAVAGLRPRLRPETGRYGTPGSVIRLGGKGVGRQCSRATRARAARRHGAAGSRDELGCCFQILDLHEFRFDASVSCNEGFLAWSCSG